ncbi:alpha-amylase family protein [Chryseolinea sp. H1M3-3]|uniref:alpha-amylase family protein n=1 Tax=Chryseolinea sp. H1M3-3 TaxID=3034144 RepID=UPI0023EB27F7|nr:alpha-amylase family protein [Chryseolinea sp. H1M3-3]
MQPSHLNRRKFIRYTAALSGGVILSPTLYQAAMGSQQLQRKAYWFQEPLRILQTVLREPDAVNYDAKSVVAYMEKTGCNTLIVNGGGIVDFFQNPLPAANINSFMGKRDILKEITDACHAASIRVIARVDFRGVEEKIFQQHPQWFSVDQQQKPKQLLYTRPQLYASCYTGYHRNEHAQAFIKHIISTYNIDGIWHNSIGVQGICYCKQCQESFRQIAGENIPSPDADTVQLDNYMKWKSQMAEKHMEKMKQTVKSFGEDKVYTAEVFSMFEAGSRINDGIDLYMARDHFDFLVSVAFLTENSEHIHYADLNYANTIIKFLKSMAPEKEAIILYGGNGTSHRYVMDPPVDLKVWLWQALAAGGRFWNCSFTGMHPGATYDRRTAFHQSDTYQFVKAHEKELRQQAAVADVAVYYSRATRLSFRNKSEEGDPFEAFIKGTETVLIENHILHDFVADDQISKERLSKYKVIILANVRCLSQKEVALLSEYVGNGGNLVATYETSLYTEDGTKRKDFGLTEVFGCSYTGEKVNTRKDFYQVIADPDHFIVKPDSNETALLINAGYTLLCKAFPRAKKICTYNPIVHNQPPEKAWTNEWAKEFPTVLENVYKKGKVIYFSNQPDLISFEFAHPDVRNLLARSIKYLAGNSLILETTAPESVHVGLTQSIQNPNEYIFSLVNTTSGPVRPLRSLLPVYNISVKLSLGKKLTNYKVLRSNGESSVVDRNGVVEVEVKKLEDFSSVSLTTM